MQTLNDFINGIYEIYRKSKECPEEWECLHESVYFNPILRAARSDDKQYSRCKLFSPDYFGPVRYKYSKKN